MYIVHVCVQLKLLYDSEFTKMHLRTPKITKKHATRPPSLYSKGSPRRPLTAIFSTLVNMFLKWTYLTRTMPGIGPNLSPLETIIRTKLMPALTGRPPPNETECELLALPARLGGIALSNPTQATDTEFLYSTKITEALTEAILHQDFH